MQGISTDITVAGTLSTLIYAVAAFAKIVVRRTIDKRTIKPVLIFVAVAHPLFLSLMAMQRNYTLFAVSLLAMCFVFGQIPITDAVLATICSRSVEIQVALNKVPATIYLNPRHFHPWETV